MLRKFCFPLFDVDDAPGTGAEAQTDLEILNSTDEETPDGTDDDSPAVPEPEFVEMDETPDEETPDEEEEEPEKVKEKDPVEGAAELRFKDIKSKFPTIFKEFPKLAETINRERAFSEVFASADDAKEAVAVATFFSGLESQIMGGSAKELFDSVEKGSKESFEKLATSILPEIRERNMDLFVKITMPVINDVLRSAMRDAEANENQNLRNSALYIAKYLYGKPAIPTDSPQKPATHPEEARIQKEREAFWNEKKTDFTQETFGLGKASVEAEIAKLVDKDRSLSPFVKKAMKEDIFKRVDELLGKDSRHIRNMDSLWQKADKSGYPKELRKEIADAYFRGAKVLIPSIRQKVMTEAGVKTPAATTQTNNNPPKRTNIQGSGRATSGQAATKIPSARDVDWNKTSDKDFLNGKYVPKRR